jgi:hypothetical protein
MAVNHADGMLFTAVIFCPIAAGVGAVHAGVPWLIPLFVPIGLAVGVGIIYVGRPIVYAITGFGLSRAKKISASWVQQLFFVPFFILYMVLPLAILWSGVFGVWAGSIWVARHIC